MIDFTRYHPAMNSDGSCTMTVDSRALGGEMTITVWRVARGEHEWEAKNSNGESVSVTLLTDDEFTAMTDEMRASGFKIGDEPDDVA